MAPLKRLCLVRKAPGIDGNSFGDRWRAATQQRLEGTPPALRPLRLAHCVTRPGRSTPVYDGMSIAWFADLPALVASQQVHADANMPPSVAVVDRGTTVSALVEERCVFGDRERRELWCLPPGAQRLLLIGLLRRAKSLSRREFADYWWQRHRPLANRLFPAALQPPIYLHNYVQEGEACEWDGIGELYETSLDIPRQRGQWMSSAAAAPILADEARFMDPAARTVLVTDFEVVVPGSHSSG
jgi:hypothetical protein